MSRQCHLTTLCYLERDDQYLMMHRISKKNDINKDKWIGVGGHFEENESPEECIRREVMEETGFDIPLDAFEYRGIITFISDKGDYELMSLFTAKCPGGDPIACDEGELVFVKKSDVYSLNVWEGDKIFFRLLEDRRDFFSMKLAYDENDNLREVIIDGVPHKEIHQCLSYSFSNRSQNLAENDGSSPAMVKCVISPILNVLKVATPFSLSSVTTSVRDVGAIARNCSGTKGETFHSLDKSTQVIPK